MGNFYQTLVAFFGAFQCCLALHLVLQASEAENHQHQQILVEHIQFVQAAVFFFHQPAKYNTVEATLLKGCSLADVNKSFICNINNLGRL